MNNFMLQMINVVEIELFSIEICQLPFLNVIRNWKDMIFIRFDKYLEI